MTTNAVKKLEEAVRELRETYYQQVVEELRRTSRSYAEVGRTYGLSEGTVYQIARLRGLSRNSNKDAKAESAKNGNAEPDTTTTTGGAHGDPL